MSEERYSIAQTIGGSNRPLLDLRHNPADAQRFVEAQKAMYDLVADFVSKAISKQKLDMKVSLILKAHKVGFGFVDRHAGQIRNIPVSLTNSAHKPPDHSEVLILLEELCDFTNDNFHNMSRSYISAYFLWRLLWIHPFAEGNGSIGRLFAYAIIQVSYGSILPGAKTLPVLLSENRPEYYAALADADKHFSLGETNVLKLEDLICRLLEEQLVAVR